MPHEIVEPANAIQVNRKNINEVASWCKGFVNTSSNAGGYVVWVQIKDRRAYVGDWIVMTGEKFEVMKDGEYQIMVTDNRLKFAKILGFVLQAMNDQDAETHRLESVTLPGEGMDMRLVAEHYTQKIIDSL